MGQVDAAKTQLAFTAAIAAANAIPVAGQFASAAIAIADAVYQAIQNFAAIISVIEDVADDVAKLFTGGASQPACRDPSARCQCLHHAFDWKWTGEQCDQCIRDNGYPPGSASGSIVVPGQLPPISEPYTQAESDQLALMAAVHGDRIARLWLATLHLKGKTLADAFVNFIGNKPEFKALADSMNGNSPAPAPLPPSLDPNAPSPVPGMPLAVYNALPPAIQAQLKAKAKTQADFAAAAKKIDAQGGVTIGAVVDGASLQASLAGFYAGLAGGTLKVPPAPPGHTVIPMPIASIPTLDLGQAHGVVAAAPTDPNAGGYITGTIGSARGGNGQGVANADMLTLAQKLQVQAKYVARWVSPSAAQIILQGAHMAYAPVG